MMLENKVALITGGASGIGAATVRLFRQEGAGVIVADCDADGGEQLASDLGHDVDFRVCDVTDEEQVVQLLQHIVTAHGRLDCAVNNAGIVGEPASIERMGGEQIWNEIIDAWLEEVPGGGDGLVVYRSRG